MKAEAPQAEVPQVRVDPIGRPFENKQCGLLANLLRQVDNSGLGQAQF